MSLATRAAIATATNTVEGITCSTHFRQCSIEGCDRKHAARGLCKMHHKRLLKNGDAGEAASTRVQRAPLCVVEGCGQRHLAKGFCSSHYQRLYKYGMTPDQFAERLASQGGGCAVCRTDTPGMWVVDHDHACCPGEDTCGECVRGILCHRCNKVLGFVDDNGDLLLAAATYLMEVER